MFLNHSGATCWEFRLPHARTGGVLIVAHRRLKHTEIIFNVIRQITYIPEKSHCIRDRERVTINTCRGGGLHPLYSIHQLSLLLLQLLQWQQGFCHCSSLFLSTLLHKLTTLSTPFALSHMPLFIGINGATSSSSSSTKVVAHGLHHFINGWCNYH